MQDQPTLADEDMDSTILWRLCESGPWTEDELERELGRQARDGVGRLLMKGMARRIDCGLVFPSASGRYAHGLDTTYRS
jgi:hypothetical protein